MIDRWVDKLKFIDNYVDKQRMSRREKRERKERERDSMCVYSGVFRGGWQRGVIPPPEIQRSKE